MSSEPAIQQDDSELVRRTLEGEREATVRVLELLHEVPVAVHGINRRLGGPLSRDEELEAGQAALASIWIKLATFSGHSRLRTWAHGFARIQVMRAVSIKMSRRAFERHAALEELAAPPNSRDDLRREVQQALDLQPSCRASVLRLRLLDELSFAQIAERIELAPAAVKARYYRGLVDLRRTLRKGGERSCGR